MIMLPSSFSLFFLLLYVTKSTADSVLHVRVGENEFNDFVADDATMTCSADEHSHPFNAQLRGVNLGGWLVLEPWITPSLFYQFLGKDEVESAMDIYSFCEVLGPEEGNRQLMRHWNTWLVEAHIAELAGRGINSLRLPVGDWMYEPYGPYIGCTDGALEKADWLIEIAGQYGLSVLIDIHGVKDSQNGFDNSGQSRRVVWTSGENPELVGAVTFEHWSIRDAGWIGTFDSSTLGYTSINTENLNMTLRVIRAIAERYKDSPAVMGLEPVNEPWQYTPIDVLKRFYWEGYKVMKRTASGRGWRYVMHDAFRFTPDIWGGFMAGCPDIAMDTHIYQAWQDPGNKEKFFADACSAKERLNTMERAFGPVIVGEWSFATDNCAMWLNGFNDNLPGFPKLPCKYVPCSAPYMNDAGGVNDGSGYEQPGAPPDPTKPLQQPYGSGVSGPMFGMCPTDIDWLSLPSHKGQKDKQSSSSSSSSKGTAVPASMPGSGDNCALQGSQLSLDLPNEDNDQVVTALAHKKLHAFATASHGFYFWNFRAELAPRWNFLEAARAGWIPANLHDLDMTVESACFDEDNGLLLCLARRGIFDSTVRNGMIWVLQAEHGYDYDLSWVGPLQGDDLLAAADRVFNQYWHDHYASGSSCDFGGAANLNEMPRNWTRLANISDYFTDPNSSYYLRTEGGAAIAEAAPEDTIRSSDLDVRLVLLAAAAGLLSLLAMRQITYNRKIRIDGKGSGGKSSTVMVELQTPPVLPPWQREKPGTQAPSFHTDEQQGVPSFERSILPTQLGGFAVSFVTRRAGYEPVP
jgi:glucan 1,3-beta-glucosidase